MFARTHALAIGFALLLVAQLLSSAPLLGQTDQQYRWCQGEGGVPEEVQISACTVIISSGQLSGSDLAWAYYNRGVSYGETGKCRSAIADFDQSIRLDPSDADSYWLRHICKEQLGDKAGADADEQLARRLNPNIDSAASRRPPSQGTQVPPQSDPGGVCARLPGLWAWFIGGDVTVNPNGTLRQAATGLTGTWTCSNGQVVMFWSHGWTDRLTLSPDGVSMKGTNGLVPVWGRRKA